MDKYYAGIGSRKITSEGIKLAKKISSQLDVLGYTLRSGGAVGADTAFESMASRKEIFRPSRNYGNSLNTAIQLMTNISETFGLNFRNFKEYTQLLIARNAFQILGTDLKTHSAFVVCWTPNAEFVGGTRWALQLAMNNNIPIYNIASLNDQTRFNREIIQNEIHGQSN